MHLKIDNINNMHTKMYRSFDSNRSLVLVLVHQYSEKQAGRVDNP